MACSFCTGYCTEVAVRRSNLSLFEDDLTEQATDLAGTIPDSVTATNLRLFFCLELGQRLIAQKLTPLVVLCDLENSIDLSGLQLQPRFTSDSILGLQRTIEQILEMLDTISFEMLLRQRALSANDHISAELFNKAWMSEVRSALRLYLKYAARVRRTLFRTLSQAKLQKLATIYVAFLSDLGVGTDSMLTIFGYMKQITDSETISPWTTTIPISLA